VAACCPRVEIARLLAFHQYGHVFFSYQSTNWDAAITPATPQDPHNTRANTDSQNPHSTQHTRAKQNTFGVMQKDTQPSQKCSKSNITPSPIIKRRG
jgi:type II secretory pathway component PulC